MYSKTVKGAHEVVGGSCAEDAERKSERGGCGKADAAALCITEHAPSVRAKHCAAEHDARDQALCRGRNAPLAPHLRAQHYLTLLHR